MADSSVPPPALFDPRPPRWACALGAVAAAAFACAAFVMLAGAAGSDIGGRWLLAAMAIAAGALALAWLGMASRRGTAVAAAMGSLALALADGYAYAHRNDYGIQGVGELLAFAVAAFGLGHMLATGLLARRALAAMTAVAFGGGALAETAGLLSGPAGGGLALAGLLSLALTAALTALELGAARRPTPHRSEPPAG